MELKPDSYYRTRQGKMLKYSFSMVPRTTGKNKYFMFWNCTDNCTVTLSELEVIGLTPDEGSELIYG